MKGQNADQLISAASENLELLPYIASSQSQQGLIHEETPVMSKADLKVPIKLKRSKKKESE